MEPGFRAKLPTRGPKAAPQMSGRSSRALYNELRRLRRIGSAVTSLQGAVRSCGVRHAIKNLLTVYAKQANFASKVRAHSAGPRFPEQGPTMQVNTPSDRFGWRGDPSVAAEGQAGRNLLPDCTWADMATLQRDTGAAAHADNAVELARLRCDGGGGPGVDRRIEPAIRIAGPRPLGLHSVPEPARRKCVQPTG
jgi:hypothetical protein